MLANSIVNRPNLSRRCLFSLHLIPYQQEDVCGLRVRSNPSPWCVHVLTPALLLRYSSMTSAALALLESYFFISEPVHSSTL